MYMREYHRFSRVSLSQRFIYLAAGLSQTVCISFLCCPLDGGHICGNPRCLMVGSKFIFRWILGHGLSVHLVRSLAKIWTHGGFGTVNLAFKL